MKRYIYHDPEKDILFVTTFPMTSNTLLETVYDWDFMCIRRRNFPHVFSLPRHPNTWSRYGRDKIKLVIHNAKSDAVRLWLLKHYRGL